MTKQLPSPEMLRKLLRYEPDTGKLLWLHRSDDMFSDGKRSVEHSAKIWNSRFAGKEAFTANVNGYKHGALFNRNYLAHRVIWAMANNEWPNEIDHINGERSDNRLHNLRNTSHAQNMKNSKRPIHNKSGIIGVSWRDDKGKWWAQIHVNGLMKHIGYFDTKKDAATARKQAEAKFGFYANHGRA